MPSRFNKTLRIGLSRTGITVLTCSSWRKRRSEVVADILLHAEELAAPEQIAERLDSLLVETGSENLRASIVVADEWVRLYMVTPPLNTTRLQDYRAAAAMRFQALYGEAPGSWQIEADWNALHPFLACAMPRALLTGLQTIAARRRLKLTEIVPQFIAAWNQWSAAMKPGAWLGVVRTGAMTVAATDRQRLCAVRTIAVPPDAWHNTQWLADQLTREALRLNLPTPGEIQLCGHIGGHWITQTAESLVCTRLDAALSSQNVAQLDGGVALARTGAHR